MRGSERMGIAIVVAVVLDSVTLRHITHDAYLVPGAIMTVLLGVAAVVMRRARIPPVGVFVGQVLVLLVALICYSAILPPIVRGADFWTNLTHLYPAAVEHMRDEGAPMPPNTGVKFLLVSAIGVTAVLTDVMAIAIRRAAWTLAPLIMLYLVPALGIPGDIGALSFLLVAVAYLLVLAAEGMTVADRWTRGLTHDASAGTRTAEPVVLRAAAVVGIPALALALVVGFVVPTLGVGGWGGRGGGGGSGPLQLTDPTTDLRRNLVQPADAVALTYTSSTGQGAYLRMASLPLFNSNGWQNASIPIRQGKLPTPPGLTVSGGTMTTFHVTVAQGFTSQYLPAPFSPVSFSASGQWGYDPNSLIIVSSERGDAATHAISGLSYDVTSRIMDPQPEALNDESVGAPPDTDLTSEIPDDLPQDLRDLAVKVTKDAVTPAEKAAAIQAFLRGPQFTYSTEPLPGSGYKALENFLFVDHKGYCEQFSAAMAMMARVVGIPSRVAVGFLPGTQQDDGSYVVTNHNLHAWPELYFAGYGWVRYEPTPSVASAPGWSLNVPQVQTDVPSTDPGDDTSAAPQAEPSQDTETEQDTTPVDETQTVPVGRIIGLTAAAVGVLLLIALLLTPMAVRIRLRRRRWTPDGSATRRVEAAWAEVRDTSLDLNAGWPDGLSPRQTAAELGARLDPEPARQLADLSVLVERARYARTPDLSEADSVQLLSEGVRTGLLTPQRRGRRLRATLIPRSLWLNARRGRHPADAPAPEDQLIR